MYFLYLKRPAVPLNQRRNIKRFNTISANENKGIACVLWLWTVTVLVTNQVGTNRIPTTDDSCVSDEIDNFSYDFLASTLNGS